MQSRPYFVALKANLAMHLGSELPSHPSFSFSWAAVFLLPGSTVVCAGSPGAASWWHGMRQEDPGVCFADWDAPFFSCVPTINPFLLFCLFSFFFPNSLANVSFSRYIYILFMTLSGLISALHAACDSSCIMNEAAAAAADSLGTPRAYIHQHHWQLLTRKDFNNSAVWTALLARARFSSSKQK